MIKNVEKHLDKPSVGTMSIGYKILEYEDTEEGIRIIKKVEVLEGFLDPDIKGDEL